MSDRIDKARETLQRVLSDWSRDNREWPVGPHEAEIALSVLVEALRDAEAALEAEKTRGIDHAVFEMVCEERDFLERKVRQLESALSLVSHQPSDPPADAA